MVNGKWLSEAEFKSVVKRQRADRKAAREEHRARMARIHAEAAVIVATGKCPQCGQPLRRNLALTGWWQCSGYGAEGFRAPGSTHCNFQTFTEN
jgi:hypothetical protein